MSEGVDLGDSSSVLSDFKSSEAPAAAEGQSPEASASPWADDEYVIEGGKKIREPREMILKRAGLGYNYAQRAHALNLQQQELEAERQKYSGYEEKISKLARWQEYNDFAEANPDWAKHVEEAWNARSNMQQSEVANPALQKLETELAELKSFRDEVMAERQARQQEMQQQKFASEDQEFAAEIESAAKKWGVDFSGQVDEQGRNLEWRVLEHMKALGLDGQKPGHFTAAFKDYYFDNLTARETEKAKEQQAKTLADQRRAGILNVSKTPTQGSFNGDVRKLSYSQIDELALAELRAGKA